MSRRASTQFDLKDAVDAALAVFNAVPEPLFIKDAGSVYLWANRAWADLMGVDPEGIAGQTDSTLFPPELAAAHREPDSLTLSSDRTMRHTVDVITPGRPQRHIEVAVHRITPPDGQPCGLLGTARDVTDARARAAVRENGAQYRDAMALCTRSLLMSRGSEEAITGFLQHLGEVSHVENVTVFENFTTPEGDLWFRERYGWKHLDCQCGSGGAAMPYGPWLVRWHDMLSMGFPLHGTRETLPPEESRLLDEQQIASILLLPLEVNRQFWGFIRLVRCTDAHEWADREIQILSVAAESLSAFLMRMQSEEALRRKMHEQDALWAGTPDFLYITDANSVYVMANPAFAGFLGVPCDEVPGRTHFDLFPPANASKLQNEDRAIVDTGQTFSNIDDTITGADGRTIHAITTKSPLRDSTGAVVGIIGITRDVTERVDLERQVRQAQKMESVGTLAAGIAHDFNNLLTAILGFAHLALPKLDDDNPLHGYIERVIGAGTRAQDLIRQLLTFSRQVESEKRPMLLGPVIKETLRFLRSTLPANIEIVASVTDRLPHIEADPTQMHQVVMNLCVNAAHAMADGGTLTVRLSAVKSAGPSHPDEPSAPRWIELTVQDTGCGMDEATKARIFEPFFTTKDPGRGTGLGLSTVYGIVNDSDGLIDVESTPGAGTTFRILFPATAAPAPRAAHAADLISRRGTETVLFADDEPDVLELGRAALTEAGYTVLTAADGAEALAVYKEHKDKVDLLVLDAAMPRMSGTQLAHHILLSLRRDAKIILSSGQVVRDDDRRSVEEAGGAVLHKPFIPFDILTTVRRVLDA